MGPALVGSNMSLTVSCSEELEESDKTITVTCMDDAKWYPQDRNHPKCDGKS